jgi:hypothetical protein
MANLKGKQKKLDANKDGKISGEDFKLLQDLEKRNPKFLGGLIKKSGGTGSEDAMAFLSPLPSYPNQLEVNQRPMFAEGGAMDDQMNALAISVAPAKVEAKEMPMEEEPMLPDEEMEEDYVDYVVEETLATEDKMYLNAALEKDAKLSEIFDQVQQNLLVQGL